VTIDGDKEILEGVIDVI